MKRKNIIILLVIIILGVSGYYYLFLFKKNKEINWRTAFIKKGKITILVKATGTINADTTVSVGTQVTGNIWKLYADFNTKVKQGQLIAVLDTSFLHASRLDAEATLAKSQAQLDQAKRDYDRNKKLLDQKVIAQIDFEISMTNYELAKASVKSAQASLNRALINLQYAVIRAPVSGVVISRNVELGQTVVSSFNTPTLFTIANDLTRMQVQANVDEADIGQCEVGQQVSFTVDAYPDETFNGEIAQVRLQPIMLQNVVNYIVIINVPNPDLKLKPGLTANLSIKVKEAKGILKVPSNALHFTPPDDYLAKSKTIPDSIKAKLKQSTLKRDIDEAGANNKNKTALIWIKKGNDLYAEKVIIGLSDGNNTEISGDAKAGEEVVLGMATAQNAAQQAPKSPFMPSFPSRKGGR